jgi:hypothetical protein
MLFSHLPGRVVLVVAGSEANIGWAIECSPTDIPQRNLVLVGSFPDQSFRAWTREIR